MTLSVAHLARTADTLAQAINKIATVDPADGVSYDLYRNAAIKSFQRSLDTAGKLLRKAAFGAGGKSPAHAGGHTRLGAIAGFVSCQH